MDALDTYLGQWHVHFSFRASAAWTRSTVEAGRERMDGVIGRDRAALRSVPSVSRVQPVETERLRGSAPGPDPAGQDRVAFARAFGFRTVAAWWRSITLDDAQAMPLREAPAEIVSCPLSSVDKAQADELGATAALSSPEMAAHQIGLAYTGMLPSEFRATNGVYYTPPSLTARLIDQATQAGVDWGCARILDPACGGGAFLAPVARRIVTALKGRNARTVMRNIEARLHGYEIDPFAAWLSQIAVDAVMLPFSRATGRRTDALVTVCDTLRRRAPGELYDLVIGNPPYGKIRLDEADRHRFGRSLFGHANLYGLFTDIALRYTKPGGTIAYVTPTGFLAGEYFKKLRSLLACEAAPLAFDLIAARKGVFDDVLQEAMLATYRRGALALNVRVHEISPGEGASVRAKAIGTVLLPTDASRPWMLPRNSRQARLVGRLARMEHRLADWGYAVSTGPLVWNRYKAQLAERPGRSRHPLIWAEAVTTDGRFVHRAEKKNHTLYFEVRAGDDWLVIHAPCVLVQRTTAKEQPRRLIAAALPAAFLAAHGPVVIENHLNMLRPTGEAASVSADVLAAFLNSAAADRAFRCVSGSVAVSAYELEALPLPSPDSLGTLGELVMNGASKARIEAACDALYSRLN